MVTAGPEAVGVVSDGTLLSRFAAARDEAAFDELVRRHGRLVWNVCRRRLARREDAEDAFQTTFLTLAVQAGAIRSPEALPGWLHRTACNAAARVASSVHSGSLREIPAHGLDAVAELARREAVVAVDEELVQLPRRYQSALVLFHLEGLERRQVAARLGVSEPAVKTLLRRGRTLLRSRLARRGFALPALLPFVADPVPAAACGLAALGRSGLPTPGGAGPAAGPLAAAGSSLGGKSAAVALAGVVGMTLLLAPGGFGDTAREVTIRPPAVETILPDGDAADQGASVATAPVAGRIEVAAGRPAGERVRGELSRKTPLRFTNTPLLDALDTVAAVHKLDVVVDESALAERGLPGDRERDTVSLEARQVPLAAALHAILRPKGLTYVVRGDELHVTTLERRDAAGLVPADTPPVTHVASRDEPSRGLADGT